jgi:DNA-binding CsgD family transcriptional regulator
MGVLQRSGLLERERELAVVDAMLAAAAGGLGRVAVVEGPAGIGKTRLVAAGCENAAAQGFAVLRARASDLEREFAFGVVRRLLEAVVTRDRVERASLLAGAAAPAASVFSPAEHAADWPDSDGAPSRAALEHSLFWLIANLAERRPLLVAVDDAQWADEASLSFLHYMARRADELRVAMLLAARRAASPGTALVARIAAEPEAEVLSLRTLSGPAACELVRSLVSWDADERLCAACFTATGGNPLLLRELAGALADHRVPAGSDEPARVARLVPEAVARHVLVRLARRPPAASALARAAAVLGDGADPRHAAALAELDANVAAGAIDALVSDDILAPRRPLEFVHPLLREVIYAETAPGERAIAHRRAARLLADAGADPERAAAHLLAGEPAKERWAVEVLRTAARDAQARGAAQSAATYLTRALAEPPERDQLADVLSELGLAEAVAALPHAPDHLARALALIADPVRRGRIAPELAVTLEHRGRPHEAVGVLEEAIDALPDDAAQLRLSLEAQAVVTANTFLVARRALQSRVGHARARLPSLNGPEAAPLQIALAHELSHRGGTADEAAACAERGLAAGWRAPSLWSGVLLIIAAEALARSGRLARAQTILDELVAAARARGLTEIERAALPARARTLNDIGRPLEAETDVRLALELREPEPPDFLRPYQLAELARALLDRGESAEADRLFTPAELACLESEQTIFQLRLRDGYARLLGLHASPREALDQLLAVEHAEREWGIENPGWTGWRCAAARLYDQLGQPDPAARLVSDELRAARAFGAARELGIALRSAGLSAREAGVEQLREAVAVLERSEARLEHARALVDLGAALHRAGHRGEARDPLRAGLELAAQRGARPLAERARQELLATGARPRRPRTTGRDALTPSERRIATMAAGGLSNREIAQALYLSIKTVEMHLGHTYRKLDLHSRAQLAAALGVVDARGA